MTTGRNSDDICFCPLNTWIVRSARVIAHGQDHSLLRLKLTPITMRRVRIAVARQRVVRLSLTLILRFSIFRRRWAILIGILLVLLPEAARVRNPPQPGAWRSRARIRE